MEGSLLKRRRRQAWIFGTLSILVPVLGIGLSWVAARNAPPSSGDDWSALIIMGFGGAFSVLCGLILAVVGVSRDGSCFLPWIGVVLNLMPLLWVLKKAGIL